MVGTMLWWALLKNIVVPGGFAAADNALVNSLNALVAVGNAALAYGAVRLNFCATVPETGWQWNPRCGSERWFRLVGRIFEGTFPWLTNVCDRWSFVFKFYSFDLWIKFVLFVLSIVPVYMMICILFMHLATFSGRCLVGFSWDTDYSSLYGGSRVCDVGRQQRTDHLSGYVSGVCWLKFQRWPFLWISALVVCLNDIGEYNMSTLGALSGMKMSRVLKNRYCQCFQNWAVPGEWNECCIMVLRLGEMNLTQVSCIPLAVVGGRWGRAPRRFR